MGQHVVIPDNVSHRPRAAMRFTIVGRSAQNALRTPSAWTVIAVFRHAFYCRNSEGALVCIGAPHIGAGPLNALCETSDSLEGLIQRLRPGMPATQTAGVFHIAGSRGISLSGVREWRPARVAAPRDSAGLQQGIRLLAAESPALVPHESLGILIPALALFRTCPSEDDASSTTPIVETALRGIRPFVDWLLVGLATTEPFRAAPPAEAERLIGLGPGLTPAGDDFFGGALVALHGLGRADLARGLAEWLMPLARQRTHAISLAHLACAAEGEAAGVLHDVMASVCSEGTPRLRQCLRALSGLGHSSGWDGLAGVTAVLGAYVRSRLTGGDQSSGREGRGAPRLR